MKHEPPEAEQQLDPPYDILLICLSYLLSFLQTRTGVDTNNTTQLGVCSMPNEAFSFHPKSNSSWFNPWEKEALQSPTLVLIFKAGRLRLGTHASCFRGVLPGSCKFVQDFFV